MAEVWPLLHTSNPDRPLTDAGQPRQGAGTLLSKDSRNMPRELSPSEEREYNGYQALGTVEDVKARLGKLPKVQEEASERRKRIEALEKENAELKARLPEGAVVLAGDDAVAHKAIVDSGMTLKQVQDGLKERDELKLDKQKRDREDTVRAAAKNEGLDPDKAVKAFGNLNGAETLKFETGEVQVEGKNDKTPAGFVVTAEGKKSRLGEWLAAEHPYVNLKPDAANGSNVAGNGTLPMRETPAMRGAAPASTTTKTSDDYRRSTESTANYTI